MNYGLPTSVTVNDTEYGIRSDYRAVLDIFSALNDPDLSSEEKALALLDIFYPSFIDMPPSDYEQAVKECFLFINGGTEEHAQRKSPKLIDWEQDFQYIVAPINRVAGTEVRSLHYLHWWTFLSYFYEIGGDCTFAQIARIRDKKARGKPLDKQDKEWYRHNKHLVDFNTKYSSAESELLAEWLK